EQELVEGWIGFFAQVGAAARGGGGTPLSEVGARAVSGHHITFVQQPFVYGNSRVARYAKEGGRVPGRRQFGARRETAIRNGLLQLPIQALRRLARALRGALHSDFKQRLHGAREPPKAVPYLFCQAALHRESARSIISAISIADPSP